VLEAARSWRGWLKVVPVRAFAEVPWRSLAAVFAGTLALVIAINAIRGDEVLSGTALVGFPLAGVVLAALLSVAKRRHHD
jgi:hypothetical protein